MEKFYITTAIDYPSGNPHIGHAYEKISADILSRWYKIILGEENCFLQIGLDEHGQKIYDTAKSQNKEVGDFLEEYYKKFLEMYKKLGIKEDYFIRTTDDKHKVLVQKFLQKSFDNGDIYLGKYEGFYCVGCERYYEKKDLDENLNCLIHKKKCEEKSEENYFFKLSKYEDKLLKFYEENPDFISPKSKRDLILNRVKEGLKDLSISRPKSSLTHGIEIPFDNNHICYVWFDALFNYYTGLLMNEKKDFWPCDVHIIGHDISWFHCVYWPAFLMSSNIEPPKKVFSHGMLLDKSGHKMSKSLGNVIDPNEQIEKFGVDEFRIYLMSIGTYGEDLKYDEDKLIEFINNVLNNEFGNLVSRVYSMTNKYFNGKTPKFLEENLEEQIDKEFIKEIDDNFFEKVKKEFENLNFHKVLDLIFEKIRFANSYINDCEPWKIKDKKRLEIVFNNLVSFLYFIKDFLKPFIPNKILLLEEQFNF